MYDDHGDVVAVGVAIVGGSTDWSLICFVVVVIVVFVEFSLISFSFLKPEIDATNWFTCDLCDVTVNDMSFAFGIEFIIIFFCFS